jgi:hypothetical protein
MDRRQGLSIDAAASKERARAIRVASEMNSRYSQSPAKGFALLRAEAVAGRRRLIDE